MSSFLRYRYDYYQNGTFLFLKELQSEIEIDLIELTRCAFKEKYVTSIFMSKANKNSIENSIL